MNDSILKRFVKGNLIDVGGDDAKLAKLKEAAGDLKEKLVAAPQMAIALSLLAVDNEAPSDDPGMVDIGNILEAKWDTYTNVFSTTPVAVFRGIALEALTKAAIDIDGIAIALVSAARNLQSSSIASGERAIWADLVADLERQIDIQAEQEWSVPSAIELAPLKWAVKSPTGAVVSLGKIDSDKLLQEVRSAVGPVQGGNPYQSNGHQQWQGEFANRLSSMLQNYFNALGEGASVKNIDIVTPLKALSTAVSEYVNDALDKFREATSGLQRRAMLIWWKESLFSITSRVSYRELSPATAATLMAWDLHHFLPILSPASVGAFLHETISSIQHWREMPPATISGLIEETSKAVELDAMRKALAAVIPDPNRRGLVVGLIAHNRMPDAARFQALVGVAPQKELTLSEWAIWVFRELQVLRATGLLTVEQDAPAGEEDAA